MKSAYELAMERLKKQDPGSGKKVTDAQKKKIADIDSLYRSKIAESEILMKPKIAQARRAGDDTGAAELERRLADDLRKFNEQCESEKEKVRKDK
jgi:hypothetical protein